MNSIHRRIPATLGIALLVSAASQASAQTATVDLNAQKQYIRGFGGMNHPIWAGDLTAAQRTTAFGNGDGQLGFTIVRMFVSDNKNDWSREVATGKAAIDAGGIAFASPWNPPASMKSAGSIIPAQFGAYATHLNDYVAFMKNNGIDLYAISVQNEPDYANDWTAWTPEQVHDFIVNYGATITTRLMTAESFQYRKVLYDQLLNDSAALANWDILGAHLYGTAVSAFPYPLFEQKGAGKERWMTEHYTDSTTDADSWPNALNVATEMHNSMVEAQFNAYVWWYIRRSYGPMKENGQISKRGYCMAQWSKFVRPGFYRVDATKSPTSGVYVSAYQRSSDVVIVVVNTNTSTKSLTVTVNGSSISSYDRFTTSAIKSLANDGKVTPSGGSVPLSLDASSVTTLRATGSPTGTGGTGTGGASTGGKATGGLASGGLASGGRATGGTSLATGGTTSATGGAMSLTGGTATGGTGTSSGTGGTTSVGGTGGSTENPESCNCRTVPSQGGSSKLFGLVGLCLLALRRRPARRAARYQLSSRG